MSILTKKLTTITEAVLLATHKRWEGSMLLFKGDDQAWTASLQQSSLLENTKNIHFFIYRMPKEFRQSGKKYGCEW